MPNLLKSCRRGPTGTAGKKQAHGQPRNLGARNRQTWSAVAANNTTEEGENGPLQ